MDRCETLQRDNLKMAHQSELELSALHENLSTLRTELSTTQKHAGEAQKIVDTASELKLGTQKQFES